MRKAPAKTQGMGIAPGCPEHISVVNEMAHLGCAQNNLNAVHVASMYFDNITRKRGSRDLRSDMGIPP